MTEALQLEVDVECEPQCPLCNEEQGNCQIPGGPQLCWDLSPTSSWKADTDCPLRKRPVVVQAIKRVRVEDEQGR